MNFKEHQKFELTWENRIVTLLLTTLSVLLVLGLVKGPHNAPIIIGAAMTPLFLLCLFFNLTRLNTCYNEKHIRYRFSLFTKQHEIPLSEIKSMHIKTIDAVSYFGGYGVQFRRNTAAYLVSDKAVFIELQNNKTVVLSIADEQKMQKYIATNFGN